MFFFFGSSIRFSVRHNCHVNVHILKESMMFSHLIIVCTIVTCLYWLGYLSSDVEIFVYMPSNATMRASFLTGFM